MAGSPAAAAVTDTSVLSAYARARAAESAAPLDQAAAAYASALNLVPNDEALASRGLRTALWAGDEALAVRSATLVERLGTLGPEGRLLLVAEAFKARRWAAAGTQIDRLATNDVFGFMAPLLRAWAAQGAGKGSLAALLGTAADPNSALAAYGPEQRALLVLVRGDKAQALAAVQPLLARQDTRTDRLRILLAGQFDRRGWRSEAAELLVGDAEPIVLARAALAAGKRLPGGAPGANAGAADLLLRLSADLASQQVPDLALSFARIATFLDPQSSEGWLRSADLLAARNDHGAALDALSHVGADDPFAPLALERRSVFLSASGRSDEALAEAREAARRRPTLVENWTRLGDLLGQAKRYEDAAAAYGSAVALPGEDAASPKWILWLLQGSALTQGGKWPEAKAALQQAYALAPQQPMVLNFLGYSQLERRENIAEATRLIEQASRARPDDAAITDSLGWAYYVGGDVPRAIDLLERAAKSEPSDAAINEHLGDAYFTAGRRVDARYAWRAALVYAEAGAAERLRAKIDTGLSPALAAP